MSDAESFASEGAADEDYTEPFDVEAAEPEAEPSSGEEDYLLSEEAASSDEEAEEATPEEFVEEQQQARPERRSADPPTARSNRPLTAILVPADERVTSNVLSRTEAAQVLAMRAEQIAKYATSFVALDGLHDPVAIAFKELFARRCPLNLRRLVGAGPASQLYEEWVVNEMTLPPLTPPIVLGPVAAGKPAPGPVSAPRRAAGPAPQPSPLDGLSLLVSAAVRR